MAQSSSYPKAESMQDHGLVGDFMRLQAIVLGSWCVQIELLWPCLEAYATVLGTIGPQSG